MATLTRTNTILLLIVFGFFAYTSAIAAPPPNPTASDGSGNTAGGTNALFNNGNTTINNTGFGINALRDNNAGNDNTALGAATLSRNTSAFYNTALGSRSLMLNTTGESNTAVGAWALNRNTTADENTAVGLSALASNTVGKENVAVGSFALTANVNGNYNTAIGRGALISNTGGIFNTALGRGALANNTIGQYNTATGISALLSNTTGNWNTADGRQALFSNTTGFSNTAVGQFSLNANTNGSHNTAVGAESLRSITVGVNNLALGRQAGMNLTNGSNNIYLANPGLVNENSTIRIGRAPFQTQAFIAGVKNVAAGSDAIPVVIDGTGKLGTVVSSARFKQDIRDMDEASRKILQLRPVTYRYKDGVTPDNSRLEYGLIAEEVAKVYPELVVRGTDGKIETVQYHKLTPMLLNEMQRLAKHNDQAKLANATLTQKLDSASVESNRLAEIIKQQQIEIAALKKQSGEVATLQQKVTLLQNQVASLNAFNQRLARHEVNQAVSWNQQE